MDRFRFCVLGGFAVVVLLVVLGISQTSAPAELVLFVADEEDYRIPVTNTCQFVTGDVQERRWCEWV